MISRPQWPWQGRRSNDLLPRGAVTGPSSPLRSLLALKVLRQHLNFNGSYKGVQRSTLNDMGFLQALRARLGARRKHHREQLLDRELKREQAEAGASYHSQFGT